MKISLVALLLIPLYGWLRIPGEAKLSAAQRAALLSPPASKLSLGEQVGQGLYTTVLGGFRGVMASWMNIQSIVDFERNDWAALNQRYRLITRLQPQVEDYWIQWAHQMSYNAASNVGASEKFPVVVAKNMAANYVNTGIGVLREGMTQLPSSWNLPMMLGDIYNGRNGRLKDPRNSAKAYNQAWNNYEKSGSKARRTFILRNVAYQLAMLSDTESQLRAFHILRTRFLAGDRQPSLLRDLRTLQSKSFIPPGERLDVPPEP